MSVLIRFESLDSGRDASPLGATTFRPEAAPTRGPPRGLRPWRACQSARRDASGLGDPAPQELAPGTTGTERRDGPPKSASRVWVRCAAPARRSREPSFSTTTGRPMAVRSQHLESHALKQDRGYRRRGGSLAWIETRWGWRTAASRIEIRHTRQRRDATPAGAASPLSRYTGHLDSFDGPQKSQRDTAPLVWQGSIGSRASLVVRLACLKVRVPRRVLIVAKSQ